jgi:hypothetical protein
MKPIKILLCCLMISSAHTVGNAWGAEAENNAKTVLITEDFNGAYIATAKKKQRQEIASAIETATADMNFIIRPFVRKKLKELNRVIDRLDIQTKNHKLSVTFDEKVEVTSPLDGSEITWTDKKNGERHKVSSKFNGKRIVQAFDGPNGTRINAFALSDNGQQLTMLVTISSDRLPKDIVYNLHYNIKKQK